MTTLEEMFPAGRPRVYGDAVQPEEAVAPAAPVPAAQVGAEAPIAPPSSARRDIFAQLGLPNTALERLDRAVARSDQASTDALAALSQTRGQRDALMGRMEGIERPAAPEIADIPAPPEQTPQDNLRVFGQFLPVLAMLGGVLNRNSATAALRAGASAMRAAQENDAEALAAAQQQWQQNVEATIRQNQVAIQQFEAATALYRTDIDGAMAQLNALAAQEQNPVLQAQVAAGDLGAITQLMTARTNAFAAVNEAYANQQRINLDRQRLNAEAGGDVSARAAQLLGEFRTNEVVLDTIDRAVAAATEDTTGWGALTRHLPATRSRNLASLINTIKANIGFSQLQAMREASPTGGALGQVTERELERLEAVLANLDQEQTREQFVTNLENVRTTYQNAMNEVTRAYTQDFGRPPPALFPSGQTVPPAAIEYLRRNPGTAAQFEQRFPGRRAQDYLRAGPDQ